MDGKKKAPVLSILYFRIRHLRGDILLCFSLEWKLRFLSCIFSPAGNCILEFFPLYIIFCLAYKGDIKSSW